ncbi:hypothetical protein BC941DRAFT_432964 [Chlamydoabsidia padenii]|nr:hypothetical protein BC941DRAFT_432964 [Chlamydoabsidia padenii]
MIFTFLSCLRHVDLSCYRRWLCSTTKIPCCNMWATRSIYQSQSQNVAPRSLYQLIVRTHFRHKEL